MNVQSRMSVYLPCPVWDLQDDMDEISVKKQAIFDSTLELIRLHGFHGAPMSQIAKNASVAAGTIYHYFQSKDHLIGEMYEHNKGIIVGLVNDILEKDIPVDAKFREVWIALFEYYTQNPDILIFFEQYLNSPYSKKRNPDRLENRPFFAFFQKGIKEGLFKHTKADILLVLVISSITAAAKLHSFGTLRLTRSDLDNIMAILWNGMTTR